MQLRPPSSSSRDMNTSCDGLRRTRMPFWKCSWPNDLHKDALADPNTPSTPLGLLCDVRRVRACRCWSRHRELLLRISLWREC
eukprot:scaffold325425_cov102-Tisochrysis_lutea.AAC.1